MDKQSLARGAGFLLLVFVAAFGGVYAGMKFREARAPEASPVPQSRIETGMQFPSEPVNDPAGLSFSTDELVEGGAVVMFLKLDCEPCGDMVTRWQELRDAGELDAVETVGITADAPDAIVDYRQEKGLDFNIYHDPGQRFIREWEVNAVPLVLVVEPGGEVVGSVPGPSSIEPEEIRQQVGVG